MIKVFVNKISSCPFSANWVEKIVKKVAKRVDVNNGSVEINIVSETEIKKINKNYRGKNCSTDVLSFAWSEEGEVRSEMLGQIYLSYVYIVRQAKQWKVTVKEEFARMLVHGFLHLVGYDHETESEKKVMFDLQEKIIQSK